MKFLFGVGREHCGKRRKCWLPQCFQKASFSVLLKVGIVWERVNLCTSNKILNMTKLKEFADEKLNGAKMTIFLFDRVENNVGKGEHMLVTSIFSFSHSVFESLFLFADEKLNAAKMTIFLFDRVENTVGKGEHMLVTSIFSFSHSVFQSLFL